MISKQRLIHPLARIVVFLSLLIGLFTINTMHWSLITYGVLCVALFLSGQLRFHLKILVVSGTPFLMMLLLVYGVLIDTVGAESGIYYGITIFGKVFSLTALFQFTFALRATELMDVLAYSGLPRYIKVIIVESYASIKDLNTKIQQILTARYARGYVQKRSFITNAKQFPYLVRPLLSGLLMGSFEKSANWKQLRVMEHLGKWSGNHTREQYPRIKSVVCSLLAIGYMIVLVGLRIWN